MLAVEYAKTSSMICLFGVVDYSHDVLTDALKWALQYRKLVLQDRRSNHCGRPVRPTDLPDGTALDERASKVVRVLVGKGAHVHLLHEVRLPRPLTTDVPDANAAWFAQTLRQPL